MALGGRGSDSKIGWQHEEKGIYMEALMFLTSKFMLLMTKIMPLKGIFFYTVHCWPCFIPWWYKTHYASHYLSVRMPGNEMIHIQEGYLRLHFQHLQTTTCYLHIKAPFRKQKAFDPSAASTGNPHTASNLSLRGWPSHFNPNASKIASPKIGGKMLDRDPAWVEYPPNYISCIHKLISSPY